MWALLRVLDEEEPHPRAWAYVLAASLGTGLLLKSLIGVLFPVAAGVIYLFLTHQLFSARTWKRLHPISGLMIILVIAAPWHILATLRNPPYFVFDLKSLPGRIPRVPLVLLHQRATASLPEPALSARLRHGASPLLLAVSLDLALSVERLSSRGRKAIVQTIGPRGTDTLAGALLDWVSCWFSLPFRPRRSITPCLATLRSLFCWARRWPRVAIGYVGGRGHCR